ncbi:putative disease resistance protein RGA3 [Capsicum annuum]|uniref:putative disease resistance protein RGA3 n=1 Tax=Capsicum annuum TaxID=4072 RepID=UPI001FB1991A|nr:putative disease resistance protein RGA3 [Capsicum annuum]
MVKENFEKTLWVCVSDVFEMKMIAEKIVKSGRGKKDNYLQLDAVQNELRKMLNGKKYLLVLDDVWNEDPLKWSRLKNMLIGVAKGSKILLTTHSDVVVEVSGSVHQHKLGDLSEEKTWTLFEKMAFGCNKESKNSNLVEIGKEIVRKCGAVPLAIRFDLITMWIAQGFIQATTNNRDKVEDVSNSYFVDLLRRSFFQKTEEHESFMQFYTMHDLIHDLIDGSLAFPNSFFRKHMKLRSFIFLNDHSSINVLSNSTLERMISSFSRLQALHLGNLDIEFLPQSFGGLKHLRYLSVSSESIVTLPISITKLHNLQVLKLDDCRELKNLPRDIWRLLSLRHLLTNLMHLDFGGYSSLEDMPVGIGQLTSLRTLTSFILGKERCISGQASDKLNELKGFIDLRISLNIKFMGLVRAIAERTLIGVVKRMEHLRRLSVEFEYGNKKDDDTGSTAECRV